MTKPTAPPTIAEAMRLADEASKADANAHAAYIHPAVGGEQKRQLNDRALKARAALEAYLTQLLDHEAKASYALGYLDATQQPKEPE